MEIDGEESASVCSCVCVQSSHMMENSRNWQRECVCLMFVYDSEEWKAIVRKAWDCLFVCMCVQSSYVIKNSGNGFFKKAWVCLFVRLCSSVSRNSENGWWRDCDCFLCVCLFVWVCVPFISYLSVYLRTIYFNVCLFVCLCFSFQQTHHALLCPLSNCLSIFPIYLLITACVPSIYLSFYLSVSGRR